MSLTRHRDTFAKICPRWPGWPDQPLLPALFVLARSVAADDRLRAVYAVADATFVDVTAENHHQELALLRLVETLDFDEADMIASIKASRGGSQQSLESGALRVALAGQPTQETLRLLEVFTKALPKSAFA